MHPQTLLEHENVKYIRKLFQNMTMSKLLQTLSAHDNIKSIRTLFQNMTMSKRPQHR